MFDRERIMVRNFAALLIASILLTGCEADQVPETDSSAGPVSSAGPRLYVFDCGKIRFADVSGFSITNDETAVRDLIATCYVIEHEKGRLLWDGGLPSSTADVEGWQGEGMQTRLDKTLSEQLAGIGLEMSSFDYMAYSHMHFDHVGVANEVIGATLIMQTAEYEAAFADEVSVAGFVPELYESLRTAEQMLIDGDHDVFGDGSVMIISAPGHTPGHQVLLVDLDNTGPVMLSGDLYHFALSREERRVPAFNFDKDMTLASMERVEQLVKETGADFWIQHELEHFEQLNAAPAYYD